VAQVGELGEQLVVVEHAAFDRGRVNLVQLEAMAQLVGGVYPLPYMRNWTFAGSRR
jgi:hypothetical protein